MKTIGITLSLKSETQSVWENGILQNVIHFYHLLKNTGKYNVVLLNVNPKVKDYSKLTWNTENLNIVSLGEQIAFVDVLIMMGAQISKNTADIVQSHGGKVVAYYCGNHFIMEMENVLFKENDKCSLHFGDFFDDIWMIPQIYDTNKYYLGLLHKTPTKSVPFIWDSFFIDQLKPQLVNNGEYTTTNNPKRISTFEPNINVVKYSMCPIMTYEHFYTTSKLKDEISLMYVTNGDRLKKSVEFTKIVNHFDVIKNKKVFFESRYNTPLFLSKYTDVVIEHQWENALNYLYLDVAYLGYPIIHNAHMVKGLGYYYNDWDIQKASKQLEKVIKHHDNNQDEYKYNNNIILNQYRPNNELSIITYIKQIEELFK